MPVGLLIANKSISSWNLTSSCKKNSATQQKWKKTTVNLDEMLDEGQGRKDLNLGLLVGDHVALTGHDGHALEARGLLAAGAVLGLDGFVLLDAVEEILLT